MWGLKPPPPADETRLQLSFYRRAGFRVHYDLPGILQVDGLHTTSVGLPLLKIVHEHAEFVGEIAAAKMDQDGLRIGWIDEAGHDHAQVFGIGEIDFANSIGGTAAD